MVASDSAISGSGASKTWADLAHLYSDELIDDFTTIDSMLPDGNAFRDEYVRIPYGNIPSKQECRW